MHTERKNQANSLARECIVTALMQLFKEKPLSAISVSELTERAGVSRMTYYRNYQSKEDIFSSYLKEALTDYQKEARRLSLDSQIYDSANIYHCFSYFEKHKDFLDSLFKSGLGHLLLSAISKYIIDFWYKPEDGMETYYGLQAFAGALYNLYISWSSNGSKETPEEMVMLLQRIARPARNVSE